MNHQKALKEDFIKETLRNKLNANNLNNESNNYNESNKRNFDKMNN